MAGALFGGGFLLFDFVFKFCRFGRAGADAFGFAVIEFFDGLAEFCEALLFI